jgi:hypothetical protein
MTTTALVFMVSVWLVVIGMVAFCYWKMLTSQRRLDEDPSALPPPAPPGHSGEEDGTGPVRRTPPE